ncbi:hypothetical protein WJ0W_007168 [Paenibacillus melissococcoides]|uniref:Uncharacterized protein n=1 Tax=Paenibacillus melissococcoides TaxID=2912268 RepID=A0ABN8UFA4_9BACL|nr:hypothetical protein [Paenibacillus melissococcoides]CAH8248500.1 hypothetical protein WJ0W_007168 [Paenibacillus melissococcoides]CAH8722026.1 hypothetical protein HTL2_006657 [Paenibacillus melissococcoides]CAH8722033.1 hypothetical protein WDD9_006587 [Paenibacillus melissococcoides]
MTAYTHTGLEKDTEYPYLLEWVDKYGRKGSMVKTFRTTLEKPPPPPEPPAFPGEARVSNGDFDVG